MTTRIKYFGFILLLFSLIYSSPIFAQKKAGIKVTGVQYAANKLLISYDITNYDKNDRFAIWVVVYYQNDSICKEARSFEGDIGTKIKGGTEKLITWDLKADNVFIDETINVEVFGKYMEADLGVGQAMLYSAIYPGLGNYKLTRKKSYLAVGAAAYTFLGASIMLNNSYRKNFDEYLASNDINESDDLYRKTKNQKLGSKIFGFSALGIWAVDMIITARQAKQKRAEKGVAMSPGKFNYFFSYDPFINGPLMSLRLNF